MKILCHLAAVACLTMFPVMGDTFVMKDGRKYEGKLIKETETHYLVEVQVTQTIKDKRKLAKADIAEVKKSQQDLLAFKKIRALTPTPDGLSAEDYEKRIKRVNQFMVKYPESSKLKEAREMADTLRTELDAVNKGAIKLNGIMVSERERKTNAFDVDSRVEAVKIHRMLEERQLLAALRAFKAFEKDFEMSQAYVELVPSIRRAIQLYSRSLQQSLNSYEMRVKEREEGLQSMTVDDRRSSEKAIADQEAALDRRFDHEKSSGIRWVTAHPFHKDSLDYSLKLADTELKRLEAVGDTPTQDMGKVFRETMIRLKSVPPGRERDGILRELSRLKLPDRYIDMLQSVEPIVKAPAEEPAEPDTD